jgi:hypothetical protein
VRTPRVVTWHRSIGDESFGAYACVKATGRRRLLATGEDHSYGENRYGHYYVNGRFVAFSDTYYSHHGYGSVKVLVSRLGGQPRVKEHPVGELGMYAPVLFEDLVVSGRGRPTYIVLRENPEHPLPGQFDYGLPLREVRDARGRVLDSGEVSDLRPRRIA